ncbi:MAG TPA: hypothetical protein PKD79_03510 [Candidatus Doudnabacteria bacterium]|nr:hypothetical protein [Candidatus Doudnabacteria bacterium]
MPQPVQGQRVILTEEEAQTLENIGPTSVNTQAVGYILMALILLGIAVVMGLKLFIKDHPEPLQQDDHKKLPPTRHH